MNCYCGAVGKHIFTNGSQCNFCYYYGYETINKFYFNDNYTACKNYGYICKESFFSAAEIEKIIIEKSISEEPHIRAAILENIRANKKNRNLRIFLRDTYYNTIGGIYDHFYTFKYNKHIAYNDLIYGFVADNNKIIEEHTIIVADDDELIKKKFEDNFIKYKKKSERYTRLINCIYDIIDEQFDTIENISILFNKDIQSIYNQLNQMKIYLTKYAKIYTSTIEKAYFSKSILGVDLDEIIKIFLINSLSDVVTYCDISTNISALKSITKNTAFIIKFISKVDDSVQTTNDLKKTDFVNLLSRHINLFVDLFYKN